MHVPSFRSIIKNTIIYYELFVYLTGLRIAGTHNIINKVLVMKKPFTWNKKIVLKTSHEIVNWSE